MEKSEINSINPINPTNPTVPALAVLGETNDWNGMTTYGEKTRRYRSCLYGNRMGLGFIPVGC
jgi:hypothetical protein